MKRCLPLLAALLFLPLSCGRPDASQAPLQDSIAKVAAPVPKARQDFLKLIDRPRVPLDAKADAPVVSGGNTQINFSYTAEPGQVVPGIIIKSSSAGGRRPAVIALHGTGGSKSDELAFLRQLAARGIVGIAIDGRYHGQRAAGAPKEGAMNAYETAIARTWRSAGEDDQKSDQTRPREHPLFFDTVWDVMRLIDYLQTREDIDPARIGIYGVSKGGIEAYLAAAADTRIAAAAPAIGVQSFHWGLEHNDWKGRIGTFQKAFDAAAREAKVAAPDSAFVKQFYDHVIPGIDAEFDGPAILPLIAPRPLLVINSDSDDHTPLAGVQEAAAAAQAAYHNQHADDHFLLRIQPNTGHLVRPDSQRAAVDWFAQWLKPEPLQPNGN
jgi:dienelactone hydrolase